MVEMTLTIDIILSYPTYPVNKLVACNVLKCLRSTQQWERQEDAACTLTR